MIEQQNLSVQQQEKITTRRHTYTNLEASSTVRQPFPKLDFASVYFLENKQKQTVFDIGVIGASHDLIAETSL